MINASIAIQVLPDMVEDKKLCAIVDEVIAHIKSYGLKTIVSPFETTVEGEYETLMEIVKNCQLVAIKAGAPSLMSFVKICYHPHTPILTIDQKIGKYQEENEA